jgi:hypothetical protein
MRHILAQTVSKMPEYVTHHRPISQQKTENRKEFKMKKPRESYNPVHYRIKLKGCLDNKWSDWFEQMAISSEGQETVLAGPVADQAALHGLLIRIRDLNLTLLSVERI